MRTASLVKARKVTKTTAKEVTKPSGYTHFSIVEKDLLAKLQNKGKTPSQVAQLMGRDLSTASRHFKRSEKKSKPSQPVRGGKGFEE